MTPEQHTWVWLADLTLAVHAAYVLFVIGGQTLILAGWVCGWHWTRDLLFRLIHLISIGFVLLEGWLGVTCPLTVLENILRMKSGATVYERSFVSHWLERLIFYTAPEWVFTAVYTVFACFVVVTWWLYPPMRKKG
ncbi:MAG: DUF2784 domain-containing protein [Bacteroidota bacterium]